MERSAGSESVQVAGGVGEGENGQTGEKDRVRLSHVWRRKENLSLCL